MPEHKIGTREEWQAARNELAELEAEQAKRGEEINRKRRELPWVPVEKDYQFDTEAGKKQLADLFEGRSQLLAYNIMFGPDFEIGACPGCTNLADGFEGLLLHMNKREHSARWNGTRYTAGTVLAAPAPPARTGSRTTPSLATSSSRHGPISSGPTPRILAASRIRFGSGR